MYTLPYAESYCFLKVHPHLSTPSYPWPCPAASPQSDSSRSSQLRSGPACIWILHIPLPIRPPSFHPPNGPPHTLRIWLPSVCRTPSGCLLLKVFAGLIAIHIPIDSLRHRRPQNHATQMHDPGNLRILPSLYRTLYP